MAGCDDRRALPFHKAVLNGELPYSIGGGIGQSACACCCWAAPTLAKCRPASGTQPPVKPAPRQASRCCKQVFHTKIQKAGYHPHGGTLPLFVFCLYPGRNCSSSVPPPNKIPRRMSEDFCGGELGTDPCVGSSVPLAPVRSVFSSIQRLSSGIPPAADPWSATCPWLLPASCPWPLHRGGRR